jgi:hypothetical protein
VPLNQNSLECDGSAISMQSFGEKLGGVNECNLQVKREAGVVQSLLQREHFLNLMRVNGFYKRNLEEGGKET